jgi:hypothetical protein
MVLSGLIVGELIFLKVRSNIREFCSYWLRSYSLCCLLGFLIFLAFPSSAKLWLFLKSIGIPFRGDPHEMRFISPYFDPNFFGAIAVIPFLLSWHIKKTDSLLWYRWSYLFFAVTIILTWSRSGIATFLFTLSFLILQKLSNKAFFQRKGVLILIGIGVLFFLVLGISAEQAQYFSRRIFGITHDWSALSRLFSFQWGAQLFLKYPFGVGYNYLAIFLEELSSVGSSLLATLICFGAPIFLIICILYVFFCVRECFRFQKIKKVSPILYRWYLSFFVYLQIVVFFTSWFNNILYFQFWLIPMIAIFRYFSLLRDMLADDAGKFHHVDR